MKASEWIEKRKAELVLELGQEKTEVTEVDVLRCELQANRELWDKLPPRFGAPHGPVWIEVGAQPVPPKVKAHQIAQGAQVQGKGIAQRLLVTGPNSQEPTQP